jgi:hypothetical protein
VALKADHEVCSRRPDEAVRWLVIGLRMPRAMKGEPYVFSMIYRLRMTDTALDALQAMFADDAFLATEDQLDRIDEALADLYDPRALEVALYGVRARCVRRFDNGFGDDEYSKLKRNTVGRKAEAGRFLGLRLRAFRYVDLAAYLDRIEPFITAARLPPCERLVQCQKLVEKAAEVHETDWERTVHPVTWCLVRDASWLESSFRQDAEWCERVRLARLAVALERRRLKADEYPDSLDAVAEPASGGGEAAVDPFSGDRFSYTIHPDGEFSLAGARGPGWTSRRDKPKFR